MRRLLAFVICALLCVPALSAAEPEQAWVTWLEKGEERPALGDGRQLEVHCINVGAADCILLRSEGVTMLVDAGHVQTGEKVLAYLDALGIDRLDYALITHPHNDHIGGFLPILAVLPADNVLIGGTYEDFSSRMYRELLALVEEKAIPMEVVGIAEAMQLGAAELSFFQWTDERAGTNERSLVISVAMGDRRMLLTADIENNGQMALADQYGDALAADILKMPHHGVAAYMNELHEAVQPELAVFTNSKSGVMEQTLNRIRYRGIASVYTPSGTIVCTTDGDGWTVWQLGRNE